MKHIHLFLLLLFSFGGSLIAQVGDGGAPIADIEVTTMCWDSSGTAVTLWRVDLYVVGFNQGPRLTTYHAADNITRTPNLANLTAGACGGGASATFSSNDYEVLELCDDGTPFYRLVKIDPNNDNSSAIGTFDAAWAAYSVVGAVSVAPCYTVENVTSIRNVTNAGTAGSVDPGKQSVTVCNIGIEETVLTVGGTAAKLLPGECWSYAAYFDPVVGVYRRSPAVSWNNASIIAFTYAN